MLIPPSFRTVLWLASAFVSTLFLGGCPHHVEQIIEETVPPDDYEPNFLRSTVPFDEFLEIARKTAGGAPSFGDLPIDTIRGGAEEGRLQGTRIGPIAMDVRAVDARRYPDRIELQAYVFDTSGAYVSGLAPPHLRNDRNVRDYWTRLVDSCGGVATVIEDFTVEEISEANRTPYSLAFLLDHSTSMGQRRVANLRKAVGLLLRGIDRQDQVSVLSFSDNARIEVPLTSSKRQWVEGFDTSARGKMGGGTALYDAVVDGINQVAADHNRGRTIGLYVTFLTGGLASGPILINIIGTEGTFPFIVSSAIVAMAGIVFLFAGNTYPHFAGESSFSVLAFIRLAPLICAAILLVAFFDGTVLTLLPVYGVRHGMTEGTAVIMTTVLLAGNILLQIPIGWIADMAGERKIILICGIIAVLGALALPALLDYPLLLWPTLLLWGGCVGGAYTLGIVLMGRHYSGAELITANATSGVLWGIGSLAGPSAGGYAMKYSDTYGMPLVFAAISICFVAIAIWRNLKNGN